MSEVNASIVVQPITATIIVDNNNINFTPTVTDLSIFTGATSYSITQLDADISNVHISGGVNGYVLETDGLGNLSWTAQTSGTGTGIPGGSNTQIQFNDAGDFGGNSGFTFDKTTGNVAAANFVGNLSGTATTANYSWHAFIADSANSVAVANVGGLGNISLINLDGNAANILYGNGVFAHALTLSGDGGNISNINGANVTGFVANANHANLATYATTANAVAGANVSGAVAYATTANAVAGANVSGTVANATHANIADAANAVAGANVSGTVANANYAAYAGNVTIATQGNITSLGTLTSLNVGGTSSIQQAKEKVTVNAGAGGAMNYDLLTQAIEYHSVNSTANVTLNFRGNSTTTLDSVMSSNQSMTCTFINTNGTTPFVITSISIDSNVQTAKWSAPGSAGFGTASGKDVYTFNIIKTAANTFAVFASVTGYV